MYLLIAVLVGLILDLATVLVLSQKKREKSAISEVPSPIIPCHSAYALCRRHLNSHILALRRLYCQGTAEDLQLENRSIKLLVRNCVHVSPKCLIHIKDNLSLKSHGSCGGYKTCLFRKLILHLALETFPATAGLLLCLPSQLENLDYMSGWELRQGKMV